MRREAPPGDQEVLAGLVERVTFHNSENGFSVLRVRPRGHRELVTVVCHTASMAPGEWISATGEWVNDRTHGAQFKAGFVRAATPTSRDGILKYLGSGLIRGIGPGFAEKLVKAFGDAVFDVIEEAPERLRTVEGIGAVRAERIASAWSEQKAVREIMIFLHGHGVGTVRAARIFKVYGSKAIEVISENPYQLARDIRGVGFRTADEMAMRMGFEKEAMARVRAGVGFVLMEAMEAGHCGMPLDELIEGGKKLLEVSSDLVRNAVDYELASRSIVADKVGDTECVFLSWLYQAERAIAERVRGLISGKPPWPSIDVERAVPWFCRQTGLTLSDSQVEAIRGVLASKVVVITGGPGVGKTTIINAILKILTAKAVEIVLCAPTGRAAKRLAESTGMVARTIHRLLEVDRRTGGFKRNEENPISCDLLVVDETSMVDVLLMHALLRAVPNRAALVIVGDIDQLASVGPGQVLADMIASNTLPTVRLVEIFRQAAHSQIVVNAHRVNKGELPDLERPEGASDFYFVAAEEVESVVERIVNIVSDRIPERFGLDPIRDIQVLCPMNRGGVGTQSLNFELQKRLNSTSSRTVERFGWTFSIGDKVMQTENNYDKEVYNGDIGYIENIDPEVGELTTRFDNRLVAHNFGELDALVPAYAITVHKSQGSEYPAVVIPLTGQHYVMLQRNLLYTAITRGKQLVVLVGQRKAVAIAVKTVSGRRRWSKLKEWMGNN